MYPTASLYFPVVPQCGWTGWGNPWHPEELASLHLRAAPQVPHWFSQRGGAEAGSMVRLIWLSNHKPHTWGASNKVWCNLFFSNFPLWLQINWPFHFQWICAVWWALIMLFYWGHRSTLRLHCTDPVKLFRFTAFFCNWFVGDCLSLELHINA